MAEVISIKVTNTEEKGRVLSVVFDNGDISVLPVTDKVQTVLDEYVATGDADVLAKLMAVEDDAKAMKEAICGHVNRVSRNLSCDGMHVYYDGASMEKLQLDPALESHLVRLMGTRDTEAGERDFRAWAAFAEKLYGNVKPYIREQLVTWLEAQGWLTFSDDGCIIGYRGGQVNPTTGIAESIHTGPGMVDGDIYNGHIPNPDGGIVEIDRSLVEDNPAVGCASGMHVGTFDYANGWAHGVVMRVKVDPRDVISVPVDCSAQKIRCCRFEVLDHVNTRDVDGEELAEKFAEWGETYTYGEDWDEDWDDEWDDEWDEDDEWEDDWDEYYNDDVAAADDDDVVLDDEREGVREVPMDEVLGNVPDDLARAVRSGYIAPEVALEARDWGMKGDDGDDGEGEGCFRIRID